MPVIRELCTKFLTGGVWLGHVTRFVDAPPPHESSQRGPQLVNTSRLSGI